VIKDENPLNYSFGEDEEKEKNLLKNSQNYQEK